MSKIVQNSTIYIFLNFFQKGINLLLLPVLTVYLTTNDYGIVAVVVGINSFLNIFYLLCLNASLNRFYYEYKGDKLKTKKLFGTIITFVLIFSAFLSLILFVAHKWLIDPFLDSIDFFPYMFLGMISVLFNPVFAIFQSAMQAKQEGKRFGKNNFAFFIVNVVFVLITVLGFNLGAKGVLGSLAITNVLFGFYTLGKFGKEIVFGIDWQILKTCLRYSLPLVPHSLSAVATNFIDRIFVNTFLSTSLVGIYSLGNVFGSIVLFIATGINQAFVPWFNEKVKKQEQNQIPEKAKLIVLGYCIIALGLSFFGKDVISILTPKAYHDAWQVVPFFAFSAVFNGIYYFLVAPLFYNLKANGNRIIPLLTISTAIINITLNYFFTIKYGIMGTAVSTLISKMILAVLVSLVYKKFMKINFYVKLMMIYAFSFFILSLLIFVNFEWNQFLIKLAIYLLLIVIVFIMNKKKFIELSTTFRKY
ncbi:O-antigen/teichoic acid export membrane protein [Maribacter vaceletii]|uniref:O-antigen/teichoic acid export membrane protein n=1 Tax=Maribacter vaceletii TaxID=1206816 RepID=A0A495ED06_9FLAO|nr:oligosaccharide flippase family protein [Maribacter vaceletii]RKR14774.1 O-antigen/teichoic acid export membrane protein [Maribacter vaceletii]